MIWAASLKRGFMVLNRNRKLIGIALISVVFGKIIDLIEKFTNKTLYELISESVNLNVFRHALEGVQVGHFEDLLRVLHHREYLNLEQPQSLIIVACLLDRLVSDRLLQRYGHWLRSFAICSSKDKYRSTQVIAYGRMYFKPAFLFKGSFYLLAGFVILIISPFLFFFPDADFPNTCLVCDWFMCSASTYYLYQFSIAWDEIYHS